MITLNHPTITRDAELNAMLEHEEMKPLLVGALDLNAVERQARVERMERLAIHHEESAYQTLAGVLRNLSTMDIAAIKKHLA